jgi:rhodanese-related sulfurtransferase
MVVEKYPVAELDVVSVWDRLKADSTAQLIDVRTRAEWTYVGVPDLAEVGRQPLLIEWQSYPDNRPDPNFAASLDAELTANGIAKTTKLYFICRSGARSLSAARAMAALGYSHCHNVTDGFEGPLSAESGRRHRGELGGWKFANLPWIQG